MRLLEGKKNGKIKDYKEISIKEYAENLERRGVVLSYKILDILKEKNILKDKNDDDLDEEIEAPQCSNEKKKKKKKITKRLI